MITGAHIPEAGGSLATYLTFAGTFVAIVVSGFNAWNGRKSKRERAASASETEAKSFVLSSGEPVQWRTTDHNALLDERAYSEKTRKSLNEAEDKVRELLDRVAEQDRKIDALVENVRQLRQSISACPGGPHCPLHPAFGPEGDASPDE